MYSVSLLAMCPDIDAAAGKIFVHAADKNKLGKIKRLKIMHSLKC